MAILKDSLVQGSMRVTDTLYSNKINLADATASLSVFTDANKNLITKSAADTRAAIGVGASGTHADSYFVKAITSTDNSIVRFDGTAGQIQGGGKITLSDEGYLRSYNTTRWTLDWYIFHPGASKQVAELYFDSGDATNITGGTLYWRQFSPTSTASNTPTAYHETYSMPTVTKDLTANKTYSIITTKNLSSITSVGTITSGTWNGSTVQVGHGGTGATTFTSNCVIVGNGTNAMESRGLKVTGATDASVTVQANTSGKTLFINSPGGAADIAIDTAANSGTGLLYLSSGNTLYINKPTNASIIFTSGGANTSHEKGRFNINGMFQLNSNVTQSTHKLLVNGDSAFTGKIAFIDTPSAATLTEKAYYQYINSGVFQRGSIFTAASSAAAGGNATNGYTGARWVFNLGIATPADGDIITIKVPVASHDYGTYISTDNGTTYKPIGILGGATRLTGQYGANTILTLAYDADGTINSMFPATGGSTARSNISGGCWRVINYYDSGFNEWNLRQYTLKAANAITSWHIIGGTDSGYSNIDSGVAFDIRYAVLWAGSNIAANSTGSNNFIHHYAINIKNSSNANITLTTYKNVYIKGTISGHLFTPITGGSPYVSDITAADDGYAYYYIGRCYSSNNAFTFDATGRSIYQYKNGAIQPYNALSNVSNNTYLNNATGAVGDIIYWSAANTPARLAKGTAGKFLKMGTNNVPIWGEGSEVTLNGTPTTTPSFYAPTTVGTNGQILMSNGTGAPAWTDTTSITSVGTITSGTWQGGVIASAFIGAHTHNYLPLTGGDVTGLVNIKMAADAGIHVVDTGNNNLTVGLTVGSGHQNHGIWSTGYAPTDSTFTSDGKWVIYRDSAGDARTQLRLFGAVWNDYAEYRKQAYKITPGHVVIDLDNGLVIQTEQRLMPGAQVVSDTFGFAIGENDECKTPLAVSGRVLVYPYRNRYEYHAGMAVCSAPNGTVDIMTREEIKEYPDAIVGIVSEIPQYEEWGEKPVKVDGRIWIKVK